MSNSKTMPNKTKNNAVRAPYTFSKLKDELSYLHSEKGGNKTLRQIAKSRGVSHGVIQRILRGEEPQNAIIRRKLGLPELSLAPVCPIHRIVHIPSRCPKDKPTVDNRPIAELPVATLRWMIEHREEIK